MPFTVLGTYGALHVDPQTGDVLRYEPDPTDAPEYADIRRIDVPEFRQWLDGRPLPETVDILDVAFWTTSGEYVAAETAHRDLLDG